MTVKRVWHGWTTIENADKYQDVLHNEIFPGIEAKQIPGYQSIELFRRDLGDEVEFMTIMTFDSLRSVIDFQGEEYELCHVPDAAKEMLKHWDLYSSHYDAIESRIY